MEDARTNVNHPTWLTGDRILAVVAGSEPSVVVLVGIFCELGRNPTHAARIYQETRGFDLSDHRTLLLNCSYLEAVITEALRLYPALPTGGNRKTAADSLVIGGGVYPPIHHYRRPTVEYLSSYEHSLIASQ